MNSSSSNPVYAQDAADTTNQTPTSPVSCSSNSSITPEQQATLDLIDLAARSGKGLAFLPPFLEGDEEVPWIFVMPPSTLRRGMTLKGEFVMDSTA
jgi:hypothetical protein